MGTRGPLISDQRLRFIYAFTICENNQFITYLIYPSSVATLVTYSGRYPIAQRVIA